MAYPATKALKGTLDVEQTGWTSKKVTESGAGSTHTVKATGGKIAMLLVEGAQNVTLKDDTTDLWAAVNNTSVDWSRCPLVAETSIKLTFGGATSAWIVYM